MGAEMFIVVCVCVYIYIYIHGFQLKTRLYVNVTCVMFIMWLLHFEIKGPLKVSMHQQMLLLA
jgi:hypothetical protein